MLIEIENELLPGFEKELFCAALKNLSDKTNPLRLNNYAYAIRELTRHVLHRLAPDENVIRCSWYKNETDKANGITRKQRSYYAVQGGLANSYIEDVLGLELKNIHNRLIKSINKLSKFTHVEPHVFNLPEEEIEHLVNETTRAFYEFLISIGECREAIVGRLWEHIDSAVIDQTLMETIIGIDELASHHSIEEVYTDRIEIFEINHDVIKYRAHGSIGCILQWGSNSDLRRGDGATLPESFPFICELVSPVGSPEEVECMEDTLGVDTSSWSDVRYGQDEA